ncbi:MAG: ankyrin repeat domain-containing protein, partial [Alphaproteobacteria bacterium]|nr:ankyrin repeat domain-containing protein [Alphaproteobacteria bacterium]
GYEKIVRLLCEYKADVNAKYNSGDTALMIASDIGYEKIVRLLCEYKADVNAKNNGGNTALIIASQRSYEKIVRLLLEAGADPRLENNEGISAYSLAKKPVIIELLSERINGTTPDNIFKEVYPPSQTWLNSNLRENISKRKKVQLGVGGGKLKKEKRTLKKGKRTLKTKKRR